MVRLHTAGLVVLSLSLMTNISAAQTVSQPFALTPQWNLDSLPVLAAQNPAPRRDSLWNGTLIGLGVGLGVGLATVKTLDAVFCDAPDGCDTPWAAYLMFGGIGAGAGAGIDFLIGRNRTDNRTVNLRLAPVAGRDRKGVAGSVRF